MIFKSILNVTRTVTGPEGPPSAGRYHSTAGQLMDSEIPSCNDRVVNVATVTEWIDELMKAGRDDVLVSHRTVGMFSSSSLFPESTNFRRYLKLF